MKKSRLYTLLGSLEAEELERCEDFLLSPYFNKNEDCVRLFRLLKPYILADNPPPEKENLLMSLYQSKSKINSLNTLISQLTRLLDEFFVQEQLSERVYFKKHLLLRNLMKREQFKYFETVYKDTINSYEKVQRRGVNDYLDLFLLFYVWLEYNHTNKPFSEEAHPNKVMRVLDEYYIIQRLSLSREAANMKRILSTEYDENSLKQVIHLAEKLNVLDSFFVDLHYTNLLTVTEYSRVSHFEHLLQLIDKNHAMLSFTDLNDLFINCTNYCIRQILDGQIEYYNKLFDIYQKAADYGALFIGKYMPTQLLKNIVTVGARVKKFNQTDDFLETHVQYLKPDIRDSVYCFNKAALHFHQDQYEKALDYLNRMERLDFSFEASRKTLILRAYYELDEPIAYDSLSHSFREYIRTQRHISSRRREGYLNFIKAMNRLYNIKERKTPEKIKTLENKINNYAQLNSKDWLLEKVAQLKADLKG